MGKLSRPFPSAQFLLLCAVRFVDPLTFTQIFPYINQLLAALRLVHDPAHIGFYSGLVESTFAFFQLCSIYQWARLSDVVGRRPVVLVGVYGLAFSTFLLAFAASLPSILFSRALAGIFSGIAAVLHSVLGEITTPEHEAFAFSTYGLFWPLGAIVGPIIGGALADPARAYPALFAHPFFNAYPYFLPCFATALFALLVGIAASGLFHETLPSKLSAPVALPLPTSPRAPPPSLRQLLAVPALRALALSGALLCFTATAFDAIFVLFCYTAVPRGGLGFTAQQIATCLALAGTSSILLQVLVLPPLLRRVHPARLYTICMLAWPVTYAAVPLLNAIVRSSVVSSSVGGGVDFVGGDFDGVSSGAGAYFAQDGVPQVPIGGGGSASTGGPPLDARTAWALWVAITGVMTLSRIGCLAYSISLVLVKQAAPSPTSLGAANGVVLWAMCLSRAGAPAVGAALFALGAVRSDLDASGAMIRGTAALRGTAVWLAPMVLLALAGVGVSTRIEAGLGEKSAAGGGGEDAESGEGGGVGEGVRGLEWVAGSDLAGITEEARLPVVDGPDGGGERYARGLLGGADVGAEVYLDEERAA